MVDEGEDSENVTYEYEPEEDEILAELLQSYNNLYIYSFAGKCCFRAGARMSAMDNATRNAGND